MMLHPPLLSSSSISKSENKGEGADSGAEDYFSWNTIRETMVDTLKLMFNFNYKPKEKHEQLLPSVVTSTTKSLEADLLDEDYDNLSGLVHFFYPAPTSFLDSKLKKVDEEAKPLVIDAMNLIRQDSNVCNALGTPIHYGHVISSSSSRTTTHESTRNKKTTTKGGRRKKDDVQVVVRDVFELRGTKKNAIAILTANKYQTGEPIQSLQVVDIEDGIHYTIL